MPKFIHPNFTLDLSNKGVNELEESHFFKDTFFTKFTLPFEFDVTDELDKVFRNLLSNNSKDYETYFEGYYYHFGKSEKAFLEIEEVNGRKGSATIKYGIEELLNAEKKLSELPLDEFSLGQSVYAHAKSIIDLSWPDVTHNFPAIHQTRLRETSEQWQFFEDVINKYVSGNFVENSYDTANDEQLNKNLMQPMPYLMHVLQAGFHDAGYSLDGDFLNDPDFKKALVVVLSEYYAASNVSSSSIVVKTDDQSDGDNVADLYTKTYNFTEPGRYKIAGNIHIRHLTEYHPDGGINYDFDVDPEDILDNYSGALEWAKIFLGNQEIWNIEVLNYKIGYKETIKSFDVNIDYLGGGNGLTFKVSSGTTFGMVDGDIIPDALVIDATVSQLTKFDANGNAVPTLNVVHDIRLNKCVPNITFGEFVTTLKNWRNLDITPKDGVIHMNYIQDEHRKSEVVDVRDLDAPNPRKLYKRGDSYLLQFQEIDSDEYTFEKVYVTQNGHETSNFVKDNQTNEITVNALPLPVAAKGGRTTADLFHDDNDKLSIVLYEGLTAGANNTDNPVGIQMVQNYIGYYEDWLKFRLWSIQYEWTIRLFQNRLRKIGIKNRLFAYNRLHVIKSLNKKQLHDDLWEVEVISESE